MQKTFFILIFFLAFTQSAGVGFFLEPFALILRKQGVALENLGFLYFLGIFMSVRFLWASMVDRLKFGSFAHFKGWIFFTQIFVIFSLILASFCDEVEDFWMILASATIFSIFAATQYIAIDGLIYKTTLINGRERANSFKFAGTAFGYVLGAGFGLILYAKLGWQTTLLMLTFVPILSLFLLYFVKENIALESDFLIGLKDIFKYFSNRKKWFFMLMIYPATASVFFAICTKVLLDSGWSFERIGWIVNTFGFTFSAFVSFFVAFIISKIGNKTTLILAFSLQILGLVMLFLVFYGYNSNLFVLVMVCIFYASYPLYAVVIATQMMNNIKSETPAFEYALQHSVFMLFGVFYNAFSLFVAGIFGYKMAIILAILLAFVVIFMTQKQKI